MNAAVSRSRPLPSRQSRRRIVVMYGVGVSLIAVINLLSLAVHPQSLLWIALLLLYVVGVILTMYGGLKLSQPALQGLPQQAGATLDERQRERLSWAMAASYRAMSLLLIAALLGFLFASDDVLGRLRNTAVGGGVAVAFLLLIPFLPSAVLAWTEPDISE